MSDDAKNMIQFILKELSGLKYFYGQTIEDCYDSAIKVYNYPQPKESKKEIIEEVIRVWKEINR